MTAPATPCLHSFEFQAATRLVVGAGSLARVGDIARQLGGSRALLVSDPGLVATGFPAKAEELLASANIACRLFQDFSENPSTDHVTAGVAVAEDFQPDILIALGGGSSMDCAKGINFVHCFGGSMHDYHGRERAGLNRGPMLPSMAVPTTAGTGSETQSFALISDAATGAKMACGDPRAAFRVAILDVELTLTQPERVTALTGVDAVSHALESYVSTAGTAASRLFARESWQLLATHLPRVLSDGEDVEARAAVQVAAAWAGVAIENAMLGGAHAMANPLTQLHGIPHGQAVGLALPHVVRFNAAACERDYAELCQLLPDADHATAGSAQLAEWLVALLQQADMATSLADLALATADSDALASIATKQWTGSFNPRPLTASDFQSLYEEAR
jgi:alcohol dehydrogenase